MKWPPNGPPNGVSNGPPNGVSNLFETKPWCLKKASCVDGIYPVYTIYPTSNPLVISPAFPMAFQIYLKQNPGVQKKHHV